MRYQMLRPSESEVALSVASRALRVANGLSTARPGNVYIPNKGADGRPDGTGTWIGSGPIGNGGVAQWVGDTTPPGRPLGVTASGSAGLLVVTWGGELEGGVPEDFAHVRVFARAGGVTSVVGDLATRGSVSSALFPGGTEVEVWARAYDAARDPATGALAPNASGESDHVTVEVVAASTELAQEALDAANAIGQHFWADDSGVHVSDEAGVAEGDHNVLVNSLGILLRAAQNNLIGLTPTGIAIYDGEGNGEENVVATFTGSQIELGRSGNTGTSVSLVGGRGLIEAYQTGNGLSLMSLFDGADWCTLNLGFYDTVSGTPVPHDTGLTLSEGPQGDASARFGCGLNVAGNLDLEGNNVEFDSGCPAKVTASVSNGQRVCTYITGSDGKRYGLVSALTSLGLWSSGDSAWVWRLQNLGPHLNRATGTWTPKNSSSASGVARYLKFGVTNGVATLFANFRVASTASSYVTVIPTAMEAVMRQYPPALGSAIFQCIDSKGNPWALSCNVDEGRYYLWNTSGGAQAGASVGASFTYVVDAG